MKRSLAFGLLAAAACLLLALAAPPALAQPGDSYTIAWAITDASGGLVAGSDYSLANIIGQPVAGPTQTGGGYSLNGGLVNAGSSGDPAAPAPGLFIPFVAQ